MFNSKSYRVLKLLDLDALFAKTNDAILLNKIDYTVPDYATKLNARIYSRSGELNFVVSCDCGDISGNFYLGTLCTKCNSIVRSDFSSDNRLINEVWLSVPEQIPGVLHPVFYKILNRWLGHTKQNINYIDAIINPKIDLPVDLEGVVLGRGHQYFYENFDYLMKYFMEDHKKTSRKVTVPWIREFLKEWRRVAFCRYLPVLSNILHTMTSDGGKTSRHFAEKSSEYIQKAAINLSYLEFSSSRHRSSADFENVVHTAYKDYIVYVDHIVERLDGKESLIRKHIFGARYHFSFRSVVVPIVGPHDYDELHVPWSLCVNLLRVHITGRLIQKYNYDYPKAVETQAKAVVTYDPLIHQIIKDLITECRFKGLPVLFNRNPKCFC